MFNTTFVVVMTIVLAIVILICIGAICTLIQLIKQKDDCVFLSVIAILLALATITMMGLVIALLHGWGDPAMLQSYLSYVFIGFMAIGLVGCIAFGISFFLIGRK